MTQQTSPASQTSGNGAGPASSQPSAEANKDLNTLLKEYETSTAQPATAQPTNKAMAEFISLVKPLAEHVEAEKVAKQNAAIETDITAAVKSVRETLKLSDGIPNKAILAQLKQYGEDHPEFAEAFQKRGENPDAWKVQLEKGQADVGEVFSKVGSNSSRTDLEAAMAATRNISTAPQTQAQLDPVTAVNMSDRDWKQYKQRLAAQTRT